MSDCKNKTVKGCSSQSIADIAKVPLLQYLKEPAENIDELYLRYPDGGEYGWFAIIPDSAQIVFWDAERGLWDYFSSGGGSGGTTDYRDLNFKPKLKTTNTTALEAQESETLTGTVNLHKVSKTGDYGDLANGPEAISTSEIDNLFN